MKTTLRRAFVTGLFVLLPLVVTFWVIRFVVTQIDSVISPIFLSVIHFFGLGSHFAIIWANYVGPLFSVILAVVMIAAVGFLGGNVLGRQAITLFERLLLHVPVVRSIYSATRQFIDTFSHSNGKAFKGVVLVEYPRIGIWTLGFVTGDAATEMQQRLGQDMLYVFLPTAPNPTSGWLVVVPHSAALPLEMTVDDAFKLILSGGVLGPHHGLSTPPKAQGK